MLLGGAAGAWAQTVSGNIVGTVVDESEGHPPGCFTKVNRSIAVSTGQNVDLKDTLKVTSVEETISVTGEQPIVDTKKVGTGTTLTKEELSQIPNSRDPWAVLRTFPGERKADHIDQVADCGVDIGGPIASAGRKRVSASVENAHNRPTRKEDHDRERGCLQPDPNAGHPVWRWARGRFRLSMATLRTLAQGGAWYRPWQGVASALLGPDAMSGGVPVVFLGIVCHFIVALSIVAAYVLVSRSVPVLTRHAVPVGLVYGAFVFWFMSYIVVSLTRIGHPLKFSPSGFWMSLAVHILLVGLPAALVARRVVWAGR